MGGITVLVIGGGGREHALAIGLAESDLVGSIHCCPGNSGTAKVGINHLSAPGGDGPGVRMPVGNGR